MRSNAGRRLIRRRVPQQAGDYTVEVMGRRYAVTDMKRASDIVLHIQGAENLGASQMGAEFPIRAGELLIGYVTYNGRVWKGHPRDWETNECVYEPWPRQEPVPPITKSRVIRNNPRYPARACDAHFDREECLADPSGCGYAGCAVGDGNLCRTPVRHYQDTKSELCDEHRREFLRTHRFDDRRGEWVEK